MTNPDAKPRTAPLFPSLAEETMIVGSVLEAMRNPPWDAASAKVLIVRLSPWSDVELSYSHIVLFDELRRFSDRVLVPAQKGGVYVDFAFLPPAGDRVALKKAGISWFFGRASRRQPRDFDLVMISNAFPLELINLPYFFSTSGLPARASSRMRIEGAPIIILGGSNASAAGALVDSQSDPLSPDSIVDGIFFGEGEGFIGEFAGILTGLGPDRQAPADTSSPEAEKKSKLARLRSAESIRGFWASGNPQMAKKSIVPSRPSTAAPTIALNGKNANSTKLAITSGCPGYCSFCLEGWDRRPYAEAPLGEIVAAAQKIRARTGAETLEVYSFNFTTHSDIFKLLFELNRIFRHVSFMSQRVDVLADTPHLLDAELAAGKRSFTLGIEGISKRMRAFYRKGIRESQILDSMRAIARPGVKELKLFFIISGFEDDSDISEFESLISYLAERIRVDSPSLRALVSAGYLVRLPFTPLQFAPIVLDRAAMEGVSESLQKICSRHSIEFRLASTYPEFAIDQVLSIGGGAVLPWLESVPNRGFVYDSGIDPKAWLDLEAYCSSRGILNKDFFGEKLESFRPPFAGIEDEAHHRALYKNYREASAFSDRPLCIGKECFSCGACGGKTEIDKMLDHPAPRLPSSDWIENIKTISTRKNSFPSIYIAAAFSREEAKATKEYRAALLQSSIAKLLKGSEKAIFEAEERIFGEKSDFKNLVPFGIGRWGYSAYAVYGPDESKMREALEGFSLRVRGGASSAAIRDFYLLDSMPEPAYVDLGFGLSKNTRRAANSLVESWLRENSVSVEIRSSGSETRFSVPTSFWGRKIAYEAAVSENGDGISFAARLGVKARLASLLKKFKGEVQDIEIRGWGERSTIQGSHLAILDSVSNTSTADSGSVESAPRSRSDM